MSKTKVRKITHHCLFLVHYILVFCGFTVCLNSILLGEIYRFNIYKRWSPLNMYILHLKKDRYSKERREREKRETERERQRETERKRERQIKRKADKETEKRER